jgi:hypothetical protein
MAANATLAKHALRPQLVTLLALAREAVAESRNQRHRAGLRRALRKRRQAPR